MPEVPYKYFMTVSPLDGKLYISDYQSRTILRVKTMGAVRDLKQNMEIIAGTGDQCVPGDRNKCGDGGPAKQAKLFYPKGNKAALNKLYVFCQEKIQKVRGSEEKKAQTERKNTNFLSQFAIVWQAAPVSNGATHGRLAWMYLSFR